MKMKIFFLILSLSIVLLCCFSAVSASEDVYNNMITFSDDTTVDKVVSGIDSVEESISAGQDGNIEFGLNSEDNLQDSTPTVYYINNSSSEGNGSLENPYNWTTAYERANDGDEIKFIEGTFFTSLNIDKNLTLTGLNNVILSSGNITLNSDKRVEIINFNINDMAVNNNGFLTLDRITMVGNKGILNNEQGELYITDSSFSNYNAESSFIENSGYLNIMTTTFTNIASTNSLSGVIKGNTNSKADINNTSFIKNTPAGSVIVNEGNDININNSNFIDNNNVAHGITLGGKITAENSLFYNISASITIVDKGSGTAEVLGTYYDDYTSLTSSKIGLLLKNNYDASETTKTINITSTESFNVTVDDLSAGFYTGYLIDENHNRFKFTKDEESVGVIYVSPDGDGDGMSKDNATNLTYAFSKSSNGGLIYLTTGNYSYSSKVTINGNISIIADEDVNIKANSQKWEFKGRNTYIKNINFTSVSIATTSTNITIDNCSFYNSNRAVNSSATYTNINDCLFSNNQRCVYIEDNKVNELNIFNSKFINNPNTCIDLRTTNHGTFKFILQNSYFADNTGLLNGIIYSLRINTFEIINSTFLRNSGKKTGVYYGDVTTQYLRVYSSTFINNTGQDNDEKNGAGVFKLGSANWWNRLTVVDSIFEGNHAPYAGVVRVDSGNVYFRNSTFTQNYATNSGGVIQNTKANVEIVNSTFNKNYAGDKSGVVRIISSGNVILRNSTFDSNYATNDAGVIGIDGEGALYCYDSKFINNSADRAGAIGVKKGNINVYNSEFINNTASSYVGSIAATGKNDIMINNSKFIGNTAPFAGAVGSQSGDISISNSYFESNNATHGGAVGSQGGSIKINASEFKYNTASNASGAIYNNGGQINVYNSKFINNSADIQAGVIGVTGDSSIVNIYESIFSNNNATRAGVVGADDGIVNIYNSNFTSNYADNAGVVATTEEGVINIYGSAFNNNTATLAGAVASEGGLITINGSIFSENRATHGGAVGSNNGTIEISNSIFSNNSATIGSGAIYNAGGHILVNTSRFIENEAVTNTGSNEEGQAGAIGLINNGFMEIYLSVFDNNKATNRGGAIGSANGTMIIGDSNFTNNEAIVAGVIGVTGTANVTIYSSNFNNNKGTSQAGTIGIEYGAISIINSSFNRNDALQGGVIGIQNNGVVNISSSTFDSNTAGSSAVFYVFGGELNINSINASNNVATRDAAVIGVRLTSNVNIENSIFENNKANRSGVVGAEGGIVKITNSTFQNNNATSQAGVIATSKGTGGGYGNITIYDSIFNNNYAPVAGVIGTDAGLISVYNSRFENNKAVNDSVIGAQKGTVKVYTSIFTNNHAEYAIGAIGVTGEGSVEVNDSTFINNSAEIGVGVIGSDNGIININNSIFSQNHALQAGAIAITGNAKLIIENSIFNENNASTISGVIYADNGTVIIKNSEFNDNSAKSAGVAAVTSNGNMTIFDSRFTGNKAFNSSGVIYGDGELNIINSTFTNNSAEIQAGVIGVTGGKVNIKGSNFTNNSADRAGVVGAEEGIVIIEDSYFAYNNAITEAGVIATTGTGNISILSSEFNENSADLAGVIGAENGTITLKNSVFTKNNAKTLAGVIGLRGIATVNVINGTFTENSADYAAGVIVNIGEGNITIDSSNFTKNNASYAGVIGSSFGLVSVKDSIFDQNSAIHGGVMLINGTGTLNITNSNFTNNKATNASGVIYADGDVNIENSRFENNIATIRAGVIGTTGYTVNVKSSVFTNNSAGRAGVIGSEEGEVNITDCEFTLNSAVEAGVIATTGTGKVDIKNSSFNSNNAIRAGVVGAEGGNITIDDCEFNNNLATEYGGAIGLSENAEISIYNSNFTKNNATLAGVIANTGSGTINVENSTFKDNEAYYGGVIGAISGNVSIKHSSFNNNSATHGGVVATSNNQTSIAIEDSNFTNNKALDASGAIYGGSGHIIVKTSLFENNTAVNSAGAIGVTSVGKVDVSDSKFINNSANRAGAIGADNGNISIENSIFTYNNAYEAGAIGTTGTSLLTIINSNFTQNNATRGGVIGNEKGKSIIKDSNFILNTADYVGVLYIGGENSDVDHCNFSDNTAAEISAILTDGINTIIHNSYFNNNTSGKTLVVGGKSSNLTLENNTGLDEIENQSYVEVTLPDIIFKNKEYNITFTVKADNITKLTGNLTVNFPNKNYTFTVNSTNNSFIINLNTSEYYDYGNYSINITYNATNDYCTNYSNITEFSVSKDIYNITIKVENSTYGEDVNITVYSNLNATFNVTVGDINTNITINDANATINIGKLAGGYYTVTVSFAENGTVNEINESYNFTVSPFKTEITVSVVNGTITQNATVKVETNVNGTYHVFIDGLYDKNISINDSEEISIPLTDIAGKYEVIVTYEGNENYTSSSANETFAIIGYESDLKFVSVSKNGDNYEYGFIIYLKDIDGNEVDNLPVTYTILLTNNTELTLTGYSNRTSNYTSIVPLLDLTANVNGSIAEVDYPFKVLEFIIDYAESGSTIKLSNDYIWTTNDSCISINKTLTIDGNGHIIDANDASNIFTVTSDNVTLKNMILTNSIAKNPKTYISDVVAATILWNGNNGVLDNVTISNSESINIRYYYDYRSYSAAVVWCGDNGLIDNSLFKNCKQSVCKASAIIWIGDNGVVNNTEFNNCMGKRNSYAKGEVEIVHWYGDNGSLINSNFIGSKYYNNGAYNENYYYSGVVYSEYYVYFNNAANIVNVTFTDSKYTYSGSYGNRLYDLYVPNPIEKYLINFTGSFKKHDTDTHHSINPGWEVIITVDNVLSGNVTYTIDNGESVIKEVDSEGKVIINVSDLEGIHNITYSYSGNDYYNNVESKTYEFEVIGNITPEYTIIVTGDTKIKSNITITVTQDKGDANYTITLNNESISNGYSFIIEYAGEYNITVQNNAERYNNPANKTYSFTVEKAIQSLTIDVVETGKIGQEILFTVLGNETPVVVKVNDIVNSEYKFTPTDGGEYVITAEVNETEAYLANSTTTTVSVPDRITPEYIIDVSSANVGQPVEIIITPSISDINYAVTINDIVQNVTDNKVTYTPQTAGEYTILVFNAKSNEYNAVSISRDFATEKQNQFIIINVNKTANIGDEVSFTVTGNLSETTVKVNGIVNIEGIISIVNPGEYIISAEAVETDEYYSDSATVSVNVADRITPTYAINVESGNVGETIEINITPSVDVQYSVTINGEEQSVTNNTINYTPQKAGTYTIIVSNNQTNKYNAANNNTIFTAEKQHQTITINVNNTAEIGEEITITITGNQTPVTLKINGAENTESKFTPQDSGTYIITAEASENNAYYSNITFASVSVGNMITPRYEITIGEATVGKAMNITITSNANIIYTVTINDAVQSVDNNTVTYTPESAGEYIIIVSNIASDHYNAASTNKTFTALKQSQSIVIDVVSTANVGQVISFNISGNQTPVIVTVDNVVNDEGNFTPAESKIYVISASAEESGTYYGNSTSVNVTVEDRITPAYSISIGKAIVSNPVEITIAPSVDVEYTVTINGVAQKVTNNKVIYTPANTGSYSIAVFNEEYGIYNASTTSAKFTVIKDTTTITGKSVAKSYKASKTKKLRITLKNSKGKSLGTVKITLKVNKKLTGKIGKKLKKGYAFTVKFNSKGIGTIKLTAKQVKGFKKGTYKFTITYKGNNIYNSATKKNIKMKIR